LQKIESVQTMWILIISLVLLGIIALIAGYIRNKRLQQKIEKGELDRMEVKEADIECCGQHEVCEKDSLLAAVSKKIEYYDDEELDQFIGKEANAYTDEETNQFRDVLYTMQDIDVAGWVRSLQLRGIELPDDLKDEVFLIIGERRNGER
jgi:succinate dehydrogenase flavin-adding protein (antitoxin of CptAB toxin-antitoxin module)